jgi:hypothetical protein
VPCLAAGHSILPYFFTYQLFELWHEFEQVLFVAFQPGGFPLAMFITPFMCVVAVTALGV